MEDHKIIELYWARSQQAIQESEDKYGPYCRSIARGILDREEDAEECVNDTWFRAWNAMPPQRPNILSAFFRKLTRNLSLDRWRKERAAKRGGSQVQVALQNKEVDQGHARALLGLDKPSLQVKLFNEIKEKGYSVRQVEEMVKALNNGETLKSGRRTLKPAGKKLPEEYAELQGRLRDMFSTKVQMTCSGQGKGKITIPFASEEELERIITTLDRL